MFVVIDHDVGILGHPPSGLAAALRLCVCSEVHVCCVDPDEEWLTGKVLLSDEFRRSLHDLVVDRLHTLFCQWTGILDLLPAFSVRPAMQDTARAVLLLKFRKVFCRGVVGKLWLF